MVNLTAPDAVTEAMQDWLATPVSVALQKDRAE
ncbi:hypothetical protein ruthe_02652 [Rubellimicrobium thermophilum DSM 16684]|uniref:Uncharacterized protein n=1 Tax=Rubellimicrobium thermophilum DSM 16684 TaxID=1123069 RepID=S9QQM9_9RHOB|nr:hypothetical protein ruthe_02652 [Rubellimicrobium thermophilum DSM 16684]